MDKVGQRINMQFQSEQISFLRRLVDGLVEDGILENVSGTDAFRLSQATQDKVEDSGLSSSVHRMLVDFFLFKQVIIQLVPIYAKRNRYSFGGLVFTENLDQLISRGFFGRLKDPSVASLLGISKILEGIDTIKEVNSSHTSQVESIAINFNPYINEALEFYTLSTAFELFPSELESKINLTRNDKHGIRNEFKIDKNHRLSIDIKFRRKSSQSLKESLYRLHENMQHSSEAGKSPDNSYALVVYTDEDESKHDATKRKFQQMAKELFPDSYSRFFLFIVPIVNLNNLRNQLGNWKGAWQRIQFDTSIFTDMPTVVREVNKETISPDFLFGNEGSISVWVEAHAASHYIKTKINNRYIVGHATNNFKPIDNEWQNVFALSLSPDNYRQAPSKVSWMLWTSNQDRLALRDSSVLTNTSNKWYHLFVRWNKSESILEFFVDGKRVSKNESFDNFWPERTEGRMVIGSWGNDLDMHHLGLPIYRLQTSLSYLTDSWLYKELEQKPTRSVLV